MTTERDSSTAAPREPLAAAARRLAIPYRTMFEAAKAGEFPAMRYHPGNAGRSSIYVAPADVDAWVAGKGGYWEPAFGGAR